MTTVKRLRQDPLAQLDFLLLTGKTSASLLYKVANKATNAKVDLIFQIPADISDFRIATVRELLGWAIDLENATNTPEEQILDAIKRRRYNTVVGRIFLMSAHPSIQHALTELSELSVRAVRNLFDRVRELCSLGIPTGPSTEQLHAFFSREAYRDVSMTVSTCVDLGFPTKPIYHDVVDQIIAQMETDLGVWKMPWYDGPSRKNPENARSKRRYTGFNVLWLWQQARNRGFVSHQWATRKQWGDLGGYVPDGQVATAVFSVFKVDGGTIDDESSYRMSIIPVFNREQVIGLADMKPHKSISPIDEADRFVNATGASIKMGTWEARYFPEDDYIEMPPKDSFHTDSTHSYYATLLHELVHWSGHPTRLGRKFGKGTNDLVYANEELIAELGAAFLCAELGVSNSPRPDHAQYLNSWVTGIKNKRRFLLRAAVDASSAVDYLCGRRKAGQKQNAAFSKDFIEA